MVFYADIQDIQVPSQHFTEPQSESKAHLLFTKTFQTKILFSELL